LLIFQIASPLWDCLHRAFPYIKLITYRLEALSKSERLERVLSEHLLSLEMPVPLQGLIPKMRGKPRGTKQPGTKVVTLAFGKSEVFQVN